MILPEPIIRLKLKLDLFIAYVKFVWAIRFGDKDYFAREYADKFKEWEELTRKTIK